MRRTMEEASKMRALCFLVSFLWVFPSADQAFDIPLPNALLIHGEPMGFNTSSHRQKRSEKENVTACSSHEYKPRRQNHCCNKCLPGYIVARDCSGSSQATLCVHCKSGTYMDIPNNSKRCEACSSCLTQYGQIVLSACTMEKNTQCGCPEGQFKKHSGLDFICQECTTCQNGTQAFKCHDDKDTICQCFHNFFFDDSEKMCRPCSQCQGPECQDHCPDPEAAQRPEESKGVLWVAVGAVAVVVVVVVACALYVYYTRRHSSSPSTPSDICRATSLFDHDKDSNQNHKVIKEDDIYIVQDSTQLPLMNGFLPLPDITNVPAPPSLNTPTVMYAIIDSIPLRRWGEFVRRLGLSDHIIETSEKDYRHYSDAQYAMLQVWLTREGYPTTKRDQLFKVLREINLGGCIDKIEEHL